MDTRSSLSVTLALCVVICATLSAADPLPRAASSQPHADAREKPACVDLQPLFDQVGLTLRRQGSRGTCSVFTTVGALEYALAHSGATHSRLSVEFLNWAANAATGDKHDGGFFSDLWKGYESYGICDESDQPYRDHFDPKFRPDERTIRQADQRRKAGLRCHWIKRWDVNTGLTGAQLVETKRVLEQGWPVCGGFRWPKKATWTQGVLDMAMPEEVYDGHSVLLIGYRADASQQGGGVFMIRNSAAGPRDAAMSYEYVLAYMNDAMWIDAEAARPPRTPAEASQPAPADCTAITPE